MGAEPGGAPLRPKAPLWVDRWLGGRFYVLLLREVRRCTDAISGHNLGPGVSMRG